MKTKRWLPSRFNAMSQADNGELILYNSYTGAIATFTPEEKPIILSALKREGVSGELSDTLLPLVDSGFLVPDDVDEDARARFLHQSLHRTDTMHLIVMPTEACNFRCTYCYQTFPRGNMNPEVQEGLKQFIAQKANSLQHLSISWFGGEPMLAFDIIGELSESILETTAKHNINYSAEMTTNGYFLTLEKFRALLNWHVRRFMITIDGMKEFHDARRFLTGGGGTFDTIIGNLKAIKAEIDKDEDFEIYIRINFDEDNLDNVKPFIDYLADLFGNDRRFQTFCRPVGRWGGEHDGDLPICDHRVAETKIWEFTEYGMDKGLPMSSIVESAIMPTGSVCYAAKPHSFVIGANGQLYKCTCSLNEDFNHVGRLLPDGSMDIDYDKVAFWVTGGEDKDANCQACFFRPACQGNHCPLYRVRTGKRPCTFEKKKIKQVLRLIWKQNQIQEAEQLETIERS
ncbi:radical SAM/SPASM domain-containing protein [Calidifontibacillus erzurumensis]|uniref:Radical SAM protein n=1 Tax=Calidifontibacillus erzurumensis TaxID=2741433 RepID=A0A8J8KCE3_9BACI|nr:radical SAM protein [Calidifontibacillus erzurumensis]NSL52537.1 radical SAM protein [Calidifontibacillus erzurumensis]